MYPPDVASTATCLGYQPQFFFRTTDVPGDTTHVHVELLNPIAVEVEQRFGIREGGLTVGAGRVLRILK